jgi:hypothetical protein
MCDVVDTIQVLHTICIIEMAALPPDNVQRVLVIERCVRADVGFPLCKHLCKWQVLPLHYSAAAS